jgi:hypothetical protein
MFSEGNASVGTVVRVPEGAPDPAGAAVIPGPGGVPAGDFGTPVHPAVIIAPHRIIIIIAHVLNCISERASLSYIMFVLVRFTCSRWKMQEKFLPCSYSRRDLKVINFVK